MLILGVVMYINLEQMKQLHTLQLEMFRELKRVLDLLGIRYYFVHGSLLSAVTTHEFINEDDDIDIAIFRADYQRLLTEGNNLVASGYLIQNSTNDDFPLSFAKFRKTDTCFFQPVLRRYTCNKGIYIDIFPIDFVPDAESRFARIRKALLESRINSRLDIKRTNKEYGLCFLAHLIYPSYRRAVKRREEVYAGCVYSDFVSIYGGKSSERRMPFDWFKEGVEFPFCELSVVCPRGFEAYLTRIYGSNYSNINPAESRIAPSGQIEVSASFIDFGAGQCIGTLE